MPPIQFPTRAKIAPTVMPTEGTFPGIRANTDFSQTVPVVAEQDKPLSVAGLPMNDEELLAHVTQKKAEDDHMLAYIAEQKAKEKEGLLKGMYRAIVEPAAKTVVSGVAPLYAAGQLATGNQQGAEQTLSQGFDVPTLGHVAPVKNPLEGAGVGLQMAPWFMGAPGAGVAGKRG